MVEKLCREERFTSSIDPCNRSEGLGRDVDLQHACEVEDVFVTFDFKEERRGAL